MKSVRAGARPALAILSMEIEATTDLPRPARS